MGEPSGAWGGRTAAGAEPDATQAYLCPYQQHPSSQIPTQCQHPDGSNVHAPSQRCEPAVAASSLLLAAAAAAVRLAAGGGAGRTIAGVLSHRKRRSQWGKGQACRQSPTASTRLHRQRNRFQQRAAAAGGAAAGASSPGLLLLLLLLAAAAALRLAASGCGRAYEDRG